MRYLPAFIVDVVLVLIFAAIGRGSHDEDPAGFLLTAWPFLVALLVGHVLAAMIGQRPRGPWSLLSGIVIWVVTVAGGILVRLSTGDTAEVPFIIVATLVLGVFLVGWRGLTSLLRRRRAALGAAGAGSVTSDVDDEAADTRVGHGADADADADADAVDEARSTAGESAPNGSAPDEYAPDESAADGPAPAESSADVATADDITADDSTDPRDTSR